MIPIVFRVNAFILQSGGTLNGIVVHPFDLPGIDCTIPHRFRPALDLSFAHIKKVINIGSGPREMHPANFQGIFRNTGEDLELV